MMRKASLARALILAGSILLSTQAKAGLFFGPFYLVDTPIVFAVAFAFEEIDTDDTYSIGPFTSPSGRWGLSSIDITESKLAPGSPDSVSISGSVQNLVTGDSGPFSFNFDALSGTIPDIIEIAGHTIFAARVEYTSSNNQITGYGLGFGAGVIPEPSSMALIVTGVVALCGLMLRRRPTHRM